MSSPSITPALPLLPVAPLDGESGYLRWKESVLLRLHTLGLAHVLSEEEEERPTAGEEHRVRDDALCRGHILATLSDRLLPAYAHHATAGAVWRAVAHTYDLDMVKLMSAEKARAFRYDEGKPLLEQLALLQALATVGETSQFMGYYIVTGGFPLEVVREVAIAINRPGPTPMDKIWEIARQHVLEIKQRTDEESSSSSDDFRPRKRGRRQRQWD